MAVVITDQLTIGQFTVVLRVVIQIITFIGTFLIGLILLCYTPAVAVAETHDLINRRVGKSTAMMASLGWLKAHIMQRRPPNAPTSPFLGFAIFLSLSYTLFSAIGDLGFIGFEGCTVPGGTTREPPASIRSFEDARNMMQSRFTNGTTPDEAMSHRCDVSEDGVLHLSSGDIPLRMCTEWRNSTFGDATGFRQLNLTDTDVLMPRLMSSPMRASDGQFDVNTYFIGGTGKRLSKGTINDGLAIIPHDTGVTTIVGVPNLPPFSRVTIPKTMASELSAGCLPVGIFGNISRTESQLTAYDYFIVDPAYSTARDAQYAGPEILRPILSRYADQARGYSISAFNTSDQAGPNTIRSTSQSSVSWKWQTVVGDWDLSASNISASDLLQNCTNEVHNAVNALASPAEVLYRLGAFDRGCALYRVLGSQITESGVITQQYNDYVCSSTTQINMVSVTISVDGEGSIAYNITNLPSDLHEVSANYIDPTNSLGSPTHEPEGFVVYRPIVRYTLSDNPNGQTEHYILQEQDEVTTALVPFALAQGTGSVGDTYRHAGANAIAIQPAIFEEPTILVINATYFTYQPSATLLTRWIGSVAASYLQATLAFNPWVALDKPAFEVQSTGGKAAICYRLQYGAAFVPLLLTALVTFVWALVMAVTGRGKGVGKKESLYAGLGPSMVVAPSQTSKFDENDDVLAWEESPLPHLTVVSPFTTVKAVESEHLLDCT